MNTTSLTSLEYRLLRESKWDGDCLRWQGAKNQAGYGRVGCGGRKLAVHRIAYQVWIGDIGEGMEVDHVHARGCRHRDCINPNHLESVTKAENNRRRLAMLTHCPKGHEYTSDNIKWSGQGRSRNCRTCRNERVRCPCGGSYTSVHRGRHLRTKRHMRWMDGEG